MLMETNHGYLGYMVAVNPSFWQGLPADIRTELDAIVLEVAQWVNNRASEINQESKVKIEESGRSEVVQLTEEELTVWRNTMKPVWEKFEKEIGLGLITVAMEISAKP